METFELRGHGLRPLPCVLHGNARRCALVLPGLSSANHRLGGTPARPDLHYTRALLQEEGWSVLEVWWDTDTIGNEDAGPWLLDNACAGAEGAAAHGRELGLLVGRSTGTSALGRLRSAQPERLRLPSIWIAPLMRAESVRDSLLAGGGPRFLLCGAEDGAYDPELADRLRADGAEVTVLAGADHGLGVGDAPASARALADGLERMRTFVRRLG